VKAAVSERELNPLAISNAMAMSLPMPSGGGGSAEAGGVTKLFVGGLTAATTKEMLEAHFSSFGTIIDCVVMIDAATGRHRGFGFVQFESEDQAENAFRFPQGHAIDGKVVEVKKAQPKGTPGLMPARPPMMGGYTSYPYYATAPVMAARGLYKVPGPLRAHMPQIPVKAAISSSTSAMADSPSKIFIGGLSRSTTEDGLTSYFSQFGRVQSSEVLRRNGISRGFGFVIFESPEQATLALNHPIHVIEGKQVELKVCMPKTPEPPPKIGGYSLPHFTPYMGGYPTQFSPQQAYYPATTAMAISRLPMRGRYQPY